MNNEQLISKFFKWTFATLIVSLLIIIINPEEVRGQVGNQKKPNTSTKKGEAKAPKTNDEAGFWESIKNSKDSTLFETYLKRYPKGQFVELAKNKITELAKLKNILPTAGNNPVGQVTSSLIIGVDQLIPNAKKFTLQLYATQDQNEAKAMSKKMSNLDVDTYVVDADLGVKGVWYYVRSGQYQNSAEAEEAGAVLKSKGVIQNFIAVTYK